MRTGRSAIRVCFTFQSRVTRRAELRYSHMHVWRLEATLVNVVMSEGLGRIRAVLVHRDGDFPLRRNSMSHPPLFDKIHLHPSFGKR